MYRPVGPDLIRAFSPTLACRRIFSLNAFPASEAAPPDIKVCLEADVLPASGVKSVSGPISSIELISVCMASATICVITVLEPWPISVAP